MVKKKVVKKPATKKNMDDAKREIREKQEALKKKDRKKADA